MVDAVFDCIGAVALDVILVMLVLLDKLSFVSRFLCSFDLVGLLSDEYDDADDMDGTDDIDDVDDEVDDDLD